MCDPTGGIASGLGIATAGVGAASSVMGFLQAGQSASRQNAYYKANSIASNQALAASYGADQTEMVEERNAASQQAFEAEEKGVAAQGTAITAAGQAGVGGLSIDQLAADYSARTSRYVGDVDQNFAMRSQYGQDQEVSQHDQTIGRINSVQTVTPPSFLSAGLSILGAGVQGAGQYYHDATLEQQWKNNGYAPQDPSNYGKY